MKTLYSALGIIFLLFQVNISFASDSTTGQKYLVGYGKADITYTEHCLGLFGWGFYDHRIGEGDEYIESRLYSRVVAIKERGTDNIVVIVHSDLGAIFHNLKVSLMDKIHQRFPDLKAAQVMLTATHTHNAMGGLGQFPFAMSATPGFKSNVTEHVASQMYVAVEQALDNMHVSRIEMKNGRFADDVPIAFNRAVQAHNLNPEVPTERTKEQSHLAINRNMDVMQFVDKKGRNRSFINWFGAHPIAAQSDMNKISSASKGFAAVTAESQMRRGDVALFTQAGAGDVNVQDFHNPDTFTEFVKTTIGDEDFDIEKTSIELIQWNGEQQAEKALDIINETSATLHVSGGIDFELFTVDMSKQTALPEFSSDENDPKTGRAAEGLMRFNPTNFSYDYNGGERFFGLFGLEWTAAVTTYEALEAVSSLQDMVHNWYLFWSGSEEERAHYTAQNKAHLPKHIAVDFVDKTVFHHALALDKKAPLTTEFLNVLEGAESTSQEGGGVIAELRKLNQAGALDELTMVAEVLPLQLIIIGNVAIAGVPFEITTVAHQRLQASILEQLAYRGVEQVLVSSYANDYASYMTTYEEYQAHRYEGNLTIFGKHQLGAVQSVFERMSKALYIPREDRPGFIRPEDQLTVPTFSDENLAKRTNLEPIYCNIEP
ncbi:MAG: neutral ceramidase [Shewanella sp.]|jgi:neutral ceramidase